MTQIHSDPVLTSGNPAMPATKQPTITTEIDRAAQTTIDMSHRLGEIASNLEVKIGKLFCEAVEDTDPEPEQTSGGGFKSFWQAHEKIQRCMRRLENCSNRL